MTPPTPPAAVPGAPVVNTAATPPTPPAAVPGATPFHNSDILPAPPGSVPGVPAANAAASTPGLGSLIPAAPIADAAGSLPTPPAGVLPAVAQGVATLLSPPQLTIPGIPGFGIPLPTTISTPHDLLCAGTGWAAAKPGAVSAAPAGALLGSGLPPAGRWFDD